jgi:hypothetical protein
LGFHSITSIDGFLWPVAVKQPIAAPSTDVWAAISTPGALELCHPYCCANPVEIWPGAASRDEVHDYNGLVYQRRFFEWIDGVGYSLEIGERNGPTSIVSWKVEATTADTSTLTITVYPHVLEDIPAAVRWLPHFACVGPRLRRYLRSVVRGFAWYVTEHEPVRKNQFGPHPWFSPAN